MSQGSIRSIRITSFFLFASLLALLSFAQALVAKTDMQRELFKKADTALNNRQYKKYYSARKQLHGYVLTPYLDYRYLRLRLSSVEGKEIKRFLKGRPSSAWQESIKWSWLDQLGKQSQWKQFLQIQSVSPTSARFQCYYYRAKYSQGQRQKVYQAGRTLWLSKRSQPSSCDPLFEILRNRGVISDKLVWDRLVLVLQGRNYSLGKHLTKQLKSQSYRQAAAKLLLVYREPNTIKDQNTSLNSRFSRQWVLTGLDRLFSQGKTEQAFDLWRYYSKQKGFSRQQKAKFELDTARRLLAYFNDDNLDWVDRVIQKYPHQSSSFLESRLRLAILNQDWKKVKQVANNAPKEIRDGLLMRYWSTRAAEELNEKTPEQARLAYKNITDERRYYSFLAAERSERSYALNNQSTEVNMLRVRSMQKNPAMLRIKEFIAIGRKNLAIREWEYLVANLGEKSQQAAAIIALKNKWYYLGIRNAIVAGLYNDIQLRFPLAYRQIIMQNAKKQRLDSSLIFAIARQESAFRAKVVSSAGARGLMQLMPKTARHTARINKISYRNAFDLYQPKTNIALGAAYFKNLVDRFDGDYARAIAAYNAGPSRVAVWDTKRHNLSLDAWIETIPFRETRNYVKNVLSYKVIYEHRLSSNRQGSISLLAPIKKH